MAEEKKVNVLFKESLQDGSPDSKKLYKENEVYHLSHEMYEYLVKCKINVELVKDAK